MTSIGNWSRKGEFIRGRSCAEGVCGLEWLGLVGEGSDDEFWDAGFCPILLNVIAMAGLIDRRLSLRDVPSGTSNESDLVCVDSARASASFNIRLSGRSSKLFRFCIVLLMPSDGSAKASTEADLEAS